MTESENSKRTDDVKNRTEGEELKTWQKDAGLGQQTPALAGMMPTNSRSIGNCGFYPNQWGASEQGL